MSCLKCEICGKEFSSVKFLHTHITRKANHFTSVAAYYQTVYDKKDLLTGARIKYKDRDQYLSSDFNQRENFAKWFKKHYKKQECLEYCLRKLDERIKEKSLKFVPSQVELSSLLLPTIHGWEKMCGVNKYIEFCKERGLVSRFDYAKEFSFNHETPPGFTIQIDTREQKPLEFQCKTFFGKLDAGDYASNHSDIQVERKSSNDLLQTLGFGYERFQREIGRSNYLVVLVEASLKEVLEFRPPKWSKQKANGQYAFHRLRELMQTYDNLQFLFSGDRYASSELCSSLLTTQIEEVKLVDLQDKLDHGRK